MSCYINNTINNYINNNDAFVSGGIPGLHENKIIALYQNKNRKSGVQIMVTVYYKVVNLDYLMVFLMEVIV